MSNIKVLIKKFISNKEANNASWLVIGKIIQMILSLFVGLLTARYLGPSNYGLINYGASYVGFFMALCTLGINSVIIKDFFDHPDEEGDALGTAIVLRIISSILSAIMIIAIVRVLDGNEPLTIAITGLCSVSLIFHAFDTFSYWFQSRYKSKVSAIATLIAYSITAAYKIVLLATGKDVRWFAFANSIDYIFFGLIMAIAYYQFKGPKLSASLKKAKDLLGKSYHYILSGLMVSIYAQTDKLMLKQLMDETSVGYYSAALHICTMWVFVLQAIIDSMYPTILRYHKERPDLYDRKNRQLYGVVFYISVFVSIGFTIFATLIIKILYGESYASAADPLRIITWYTAFSYLGVARNAWIVCENKQKYLKYMYLGAAILNVIFNALLIPFFGPSGAAMASLITQVFTSIVLPSMIKEMRPNAVLMLQAISLKDYSLKFIRKTKR